MNTNDSTSNRQKHLQVLIGEFDVAMLVTHTTNGLHSRPMAISCLDDSTEAYLVTHIHSIKVDEISANPKALLTFQGATQFASVQGELTVIQDRDLIEKMWKEAWKVWFPAGKSDSNIALLKFTAHEGEYWDNAGLQGLKYLYTSAKAYVTGDTPKPAGDAQHAKVRL